MARTLDQLKEISESIIRRAAYEIWIKKGMIHGGDMDDWLEAEGDEAVMMEITMNIAHDSLFYKLYKAKKNQSFTSSAFGEIIVDVIENFLCEVQLGNMVKSLEVSLEDVNEKERILRIQNIILRASVETFFWMMYIKHSESRGTEQTRIDEYRGNFCDQYNKIHSDISAQPFVSALAGSGGIGSISTSFAFPNKLDVRSMLDHVKNDFGNKISYIYPIYRLASLSVHGIDIMSLKKFFFKSGGAFPYVKWDKVVQVISSEYFHMLP
ncbi:MAG: DUF2934 domain-containing protein [Rhodospirillaceae bacterium]